MLLSYRSIVAFSYGTSRNHRALAPLGSALMPSSTFISGKFGHFTLTAEMQTETRRFCPIDIRHYEPTARPMSLSASILSTGHSEKPIWRALPARTISLSAVIVSSSGVASS